MKHNYLILSFFFVLIFSGCATVKNKNYNPDKKYSVQQLQQDFLLLRNILEKKHPALYWYTSKPEMDYAFDKAYSNISDSMTELRFAWNILAPITHMIRCGHTSVGMSKNWDKYIKDKQLPSFPLYLKACRDTFVVTGNLNRKDSVIKKGTILTSINGFKNREIIKYVFNCLPLDGYADNVNYIRLSSNFPYFHRNVFGIYSTYRVGFVDSSGQEKFTTIPLFSPKIPEPSKVKKGIPQKKVIPEKKDSKKKKRNKLIESYRSFSADSINSTGTMTLNTFSRGKRKHLRSFFRKKFKEIEKKNLKNLIIDIRGNGGGDMGMYVLLTKYLRHTPFKVADSAYTVSRSLKPFTGKIKGGFFNNFGLFFLTTKKKDGNYHFRYWEKHIFKPKTNHHFNGQLYVLINGPTFSASTLFCNAIKGQENIKLVGEETGGGWYGNSGIMIPDIILPNTKLRVRLPLFRIVQYNHISTKGTGVIPDIYIQPTVEGVRKEIDRKMEFVKEMIRNGPTKQ